MHSLSLLGQSAVRYAEQGWAVFPQSPKGKAPLIPSDEQKAIEQGWGAAGHGCLDGTDSVEQVAEWWAKEPNANIGIATGPKSALFIADVDGDTARVTLKSMGDIGAPRIQKTSKGWHLFYAWTDDCGGVTVSVGRVGPQIDIRGEGGAITVSPSVHRSGFVYNWLNEAELQPPPTWLIKAAIGEQKPNRPYYPPAEPRSDRRASNYGMAALENACNRIISASYGQQEVTLNGECYSIGMLVGGGEIDAQWAAYILIRAGQNISSAPGQRRWNPHDIEKKVRAAITAGMGQPKYVERRHGG